jgi:hypothetical protein
LRFSLVVSPGAAPIKHIPDIVPVAAVASGGRRPTASTVTIHPKTPLGTYLVRACVDILNEVVESSDENNCGTSVETITVQ